MVTIDNQSYNYDEGVYYVKTDGGYKVVEAPVGATVKEIPKGAETVVIDNSVKNYYYGGTYYEKSDKGYTVVPPTAGSLVENLPEGGEEVTMGDIKMVKVGNTYYQPVKVEGKKMYEVVDVRKAEDDKDGKEGKDSTKQ